MDRLKQVIKQLSEDYKDILDGNSRHYLEVSIAEKAAEMGLKKAEERYKDAFAIVPLKHPLDGMKVRIDGRTFVNYAQFDSGIAVPPYIANQVDLSKKSYAVWDSMICNFA